MYKFKVTMFLMLIFFPNLVSAVKQEIKHLDIG